jgi:hypothetical protein
VNYCAVAAAQYLALGDVATLQYSKRPSPLSLGRIGAAREQNRLLLLHVLDRLRGRPADLRPRVVLFGESLGAHTSQDVLMHRGTLGPQALGVDRALWIGTPYASKWMRQVTGAARPDVYPALVAVFNDFDQYTALPPRTGLGCATSWSATTTGTKFGADLVVSRPGWLAPDRRRHDGAGGEVPRCPTRRWGGARSPRSSEPPRRWFGDGRSCSCSGPAGAPVRQTHPLSAIHGSGAPVIRLQALAPFKPPCGEPRSTTCQVATTSRQA